MTQSNTPVVAVGAMTVRLPKKNGIIPAVVAIPHRLHLRPRSIRAAAAAVVFVRPGAFMRRWDCR
jgi:hypothetical protein